MSRTYMAKPLEVESKWYIIDAAGMPLGRVSSRVAAILKGKNKPQYTPHVDCGDHVIVINCNQVALTGNKLDQKVYRAYSGYPGGLKEITFRKLLQEKADFAVLNAVKGMLPRTSLGRKQLTKLRVYKDANHNHQAQKPIALKFE